jgi:hypothetical protein
MAFLRFPSFQAALMRFLLCEQLLISRTIARRFDDVKPGFSGSIRAFDRWSYK